MGLAALTFGNGTFEHSVAHTEFTHINLNGHHYPRIPLTEEDPHVEITRPWEHIKKNENAENKATIKKACSFFGENTTYLICHVTSGRVRAGMRGTVNGKPFRIIEIQAKLNAPYAVKGMDAGLTVEGVSPKDLSKDYKIVFSE